MNYINSAITNLQQICLDCKNYETTQCIKAKCNVGFALSIANSIEKNGLTIIKDGLELIPKEDMKNYDYRMIARCIASICKLCKQCNEKHNENCSISLARKSIEGIFLKETLYYPGNVLTYIFNIAEQSSSFADLIQEELQQLD